MCPRKRIFLATISIFFSFFLFPLLPGNSEVLDTPFATLQPQVLMVSVLYRPILILPQPVKQVRCQLT